MVSSSSGEEPNNNKNNKSEKAKQKRVFFFLFSSPVLLPPPYENERAISRRRWRKRGSGPSTFPLTLSARSMPSSCHVNYTALGSFTAASSPVHVKTPAADNLAFSSIGIFTTASLFPCSALYVSLSLPSKDDNVDMKDGTKSRPFNNGRAEKINKNKTADLLTTGPSAHLPLRSCFDDRISLSSLFRSFSCSKLIYWRFVTLPFLFFFSSTWTVCSAR